VDIDGIPTGKFRSQWDRLAGLTDMFREECRPHGGLVPIGEVYGRPPRRESTAKTPSDSPTN
jgi:hypothetical protein